MKILHTVELYYPSVGGMQEVVKQLSENLVRLGHDVTVATTKLASRKDRVLNSVSIEEFAVSGNLARGMTGDVENYRNFIFNSDFDAITNFAAQQWATDAVITMLERIKTRKVFVPTGFSGLYDRTYAGYFESMKEWMKQYDMNVFISEDYRDINFARQNGVDKRMVISNGASEEEFLPESGIDICAALGIPRDHFLILHVGNHTGIKGHTEAIRIFSKARIGNATFLIIANDFGYGCANSCKRRKTIFNFRLKHKFDDKQLIITSLPRQETIAAYKEADLFLFPSNIECSPLVLFECMASKTPFLSTDVGNATEIVQWSQGGMLLPTIKKENGFSLANISGSVKVLEDIYHDSSARMNMQENGFRAWQERFTWSRIAKEYEVLYSSLVGCKHENALHI